MPIYDYVCHHCGHRFEVIHGVHADGPRTCPVCGGGPVRKAISAPSIHFKGSGWAKKDRGSAARKAASASETAPAAASGDGGSSADGAPSSTTATSSTDKPAAEKSSSSNGSAATVKDRD